MDELLGVWYCVDRTELRFYSPNMQRYWDSFVEKGETIVLLFTPERPHDDIAMLYWHEILVRERPCRISCSRSDWKKLFVR